MARRSTRSAFRDIHDPRTLRAVAHPFRLTLLDLLERHETLTSAQASSLTGESTGSCSFHLRQLAKYGFVERADATNGKERPWRRATSGERVPDSSNRELDFAAGELTKLLVDRLATDAAAWLKRRKDLPPEWRGGVLDQELLYLTPSELQELSRAVVDMFAQYRERGARTSARPKDAGAVRVAAMLFPLPPDDDGR